MINRFDSFLKRNASVILASVLFNAFFLFVFFLSFNSLSGKMDSTESPLHREEVSVIDVVARAEPAVVSIVATAELPQISEEERRFLEFFAPGLSIPEGGSTREVGGASGFLVTSNGLIVTNKHVVANESLGYSVVMSDGRHFTAEVLAKDLMYDVAILKIDIENAPYLEFGDSSDIVLGQTVLAIGNALSELANTVTKGIISGLSRSVVASGPRGQTEMLENVIQTDAGINPGNSGGPLLDLSGNVIGVNVAVAQGSENIGFSLPSNLVQSIVASVQKHGEIIVPYIGVRYVVLDERLAQSEGLTVTNGVLIVSGDAGEPAVIPDSPASRAGLQRGDVITHFNGKPINQENSFARLIREAGVGSETTLSVVRGDEALTLVVVLDRVPSDL